MGFRQMGPITPPNPLIIQLTDRQDGTIWTLSHRASDERIAINDDPIPRFYRGFIVRYDALDGPRLPEFPYLRFFVRGGRLGVEEMPDLPGFYVQNQPPILTRKGFEQYSLRVSAGLWPRGMPGWVLEYDNRT
jgi:hypothetical protein